MNTKSFKLAKTSIKCADRNANSVQMPFEWNKISENHLRMWKYNIFLGKISTKTVDDQKWIKTHGSYLLTSAKRAELNYLRFDRVVVDVTNGDSTSYAYSRVNVFVGQRLNDDVSRFRVASDGIRYGVRRNGLSLDTASFKWEPSELDWNVNWVFLQISDNVFSNFESKN